MVNVHSRGITLKVLDTVYFVTMGALFPISAFSNDEFQLTPRKYDLLTFSDSTISNGLMNTVLVH